MVRFEDESTAFEGALVDSVLGSCILDNLLHNLLLPVVMHKEDVSFPVCIGLEHIFPAFCAEMVFLVSLFEAGQTKV